MKKKEEVEIMFGDSRATIITEQPQTLFRIIRALKEDGHDPQIRVYDEELRDMTCWQPTKAA